MKHIADTVLRFAADTNRWDHACTIEGGFAHGGFVARGNDWWLAGGFDTRGPSATIRSLDLTRGRVRHLADLPEPRAYCGAAFLDDELWVVGGTARDGDYTALPASAFRVDTRTVEIRRFDGPAIVNPVVLVLQGEVHVLPGSIWSGERKRLEAPAEVWIYRPGAERWIRRPLPRSLPRGLSGVAIDGRRAFLAGGVEVQEAVGKIGRRTWIYDALDGSVAPGPELPEPRLASAVATDGTTIWLSGGEDKPRGRASTVWQLPVPTRAIK
jgi:N-acetylneuraminic acid mutarotase